MTRPTFLGHTMSLINALESIVGPTHVLIEGDLSAFEQDWRKRSKGRALCVVSPSSTEEVAQVIKACAAHQTSIVPQGGNTGLVVGSIPDESGQQVLLSLKRMRSIEAIDTDNLSITVQAGCVLQEIQEAANHVDLLFPLSLGSEGSCTIGGNLSTNAGGTQVLRYGNTRDLCLGLEVVSASGEIYSGLSGLRKDNTGYDLKNLFIGAEGTLGIITRATMKLYPKPKATLTAFVAVNDLECCVNLLARAHQALSAQLTGFEVMNQFSMSLVSKHIPQLACPFPSAAWCVLLEVSDSESESHASAQLEELLSQAMAHDVVNDAIIADSLQKAKHLWHIRESITMAQAMEGLNIKNDISLPVSSITEFVRATDQALKEMLSGIQLVNFGHLGDGNLHYNVQAPAGMPASDFLLEFEEQVNTLVYQKVKAFKGSISAEHGIGSLKVHTLPHYKDTIALKLMRQIKTSLDPLNTMNPNRVVLLA